MMLRRTLLGALASLFGVGSAAAMRPGEPSSDVNVHPDYHERLRYLSAMRDLLLPALFDWRSDFQDHTAIPEYDIAILPDALLIYLRVRGDMIKREIRVEDLRNGSYKKFFRPMLDEMRLSVDAKHAIRWHRSRYSDPSAIYFGDPVKPLVLRG